MGERLGADESASSPQVGAGIGYDFRTSEAFALAPELRIQWASFEEAGTSAGAFRYKDGVWAGLTLVGHILL